MYQSFIALFFTDNYQDGRRKLRIAEDTSDLQTDTEEDLGRGSRRYYFSKFDTYYRAMVFKNLIDYYSDVLYNLHTIYDCVIWSMIIPL